MRLRILKLLQRLKGIHYGLPGHISYQAKKNILGTHWVRLPNCKSFKIKLNPWNIVALFFGIKTRNKPQFEFEPYLNKKFNRYLVKQIKRLIDAKKDPKRFFQIVRFLMAKSVIFRVSAISKTKPRWYKEMPLWLVIRAIRRSIKLIGSDKMEYKRLYIPKGKDELRPLGIPKLEWRIHQQMLNNFLFIFIKDYYLPSQHGFIPKKGTLTAWIALLSKFDKFKYVYEFDLKQFFPSVNLIVINNILIELGVPKDICRHILEMNKQVPEMPKSGPLMHEPRYIMDKANKIYSANVDILNTMYKKEERSMKLNQIFNINMRRDTILSIFNKSKGPSTEHKGVPQGSNLGPTLSILVLKEFLKQHESVSYADDGLFFSDHPFEIKGDVWKGINIHEKKSGWVKWEGKQLKPLKFLGLIYHEGLLRAETRKGSKLIANSMHEAYSVLTTWKAEGKNLIYNKSWEDIFKGSFGGNLLSKLYNGSWNLETNSKTDFKFRNKSCVSMFKKRHSWTLYNASSYATYSLICILYGRKTMNKRLRSIRIRKIRT